MDSLVSRSRDAGSESGDVFRRDQIYFAGAAGSREGIPGKAKPKATPEATGTPKTTDTSGFHCSDGNYCTGGFPENATATSSETDGKTAEPTKMPTADINPAA